MEKDIDIRTYSPLALAYIGDSVFDIIVRTKVVKAGNASVNSLHKNSVKYVSAKAQCQMVLNIMDEFTEDEKNVFRRGKNTKMHTTAKNASLQEYRNATGFEAVLGWLYLQGMTDRVEELAKKAMESI